MEFLDKLSIGDVVWVKTINSFGAETIYKDIVLRKLKTKIETRSGEFNIKNGEHLNNNQVGQVLLKYIVEYTDEIEKNILNQTYQELLNEMSKLPFKDNKIFKSFIDKLKNLYNANKGV